MSMLGPIANYMWKKILSIEITKNIFVLISIPYDRTTKKTKKVDDFFFHTSVLIVCILPYVLKGLLTRALWHNRDLWNHWLGAWQQQTITGNDTGWSTHLMIGYPWMEYSCGRFTNTV